MSLIGKLIGNTPEVQGMSTILALGNTGLSYNSILQIVLHALIMAIISKILFSRYFESKIRFLWRSFFLFLSVLFTTSIFIVVFQWFPIDNVYAWISFILSFIIWFTIVIALTFLALKIKDKKYNQLLKDIRSSIK